MAYTTVTAKLDLQDFIVTSMSTSAAQILVSMENVRMVSIGMTVSAVKVSGEPTVKERSTMKEVCYRGPLDNISCNLFRDWVSELKF